MSATPPSNQLPSGRHGLPRSFVVHNQRERILDAVAQTVAEHGYGPTSVELVVKRAGVSRKTFYEQFSNKEECFLAAYDAVVVQMMGTVVGAFESSTGPWEERIGAGMRAFLGFVGSEPAFARLAFVEAIAAGPAGRERYRDAIAGFYPYFAQGREAEAGARFGPVPELTERAVVGGVAAVVNARVVAGEGIAPEDLLADLLEFALTPYVGHERAREVAAATAA